jgi:hypothetical protein
VEAGDNDGGTPPTGITSKHSQLARPGPVPVDDDSWDAEHAWLKSDASVGEPDRYHGLRRARGTSSEYRWWIGGAAALIASTAAIALIMAPSSGNGSAPSAGAVSETADGQGETEAGQSPVGDGSPPVGVSTAAGGPSGGGTGQPPFAVTIEAESGSPMVILTGSAVVESDERASGGQIVTNLGNSGNGGEPGAVQINSISLPGAGVYRISIHYANLDTSHSAAVIAVTGAEPTTVNFTGNRRCCGVRTIDVTLAAGSHVLTITNATGPAPSIDRIVVSRA